MKRRFKTLMITLLFTMIFSTKVFTADTDEIKIDGSFDDWDDKPVFNDYKRDIISEWLNFLEVRYFADDQYLYLYVTRVAAKKSDPWDFEVIILNAQKERNYEEDIPVEYEHFQVITITDPLNMKI